MPQDQRNILRIPILTRFASRTATAEAKIAQVVQANSQIAQEIENAATDPAHPNLANIVAGAGHQVARNTLDVVNIAGGTADQAISQDRLAGEEGRDPDAAALAAALRESSAYTKIKEYMNDIEADVEHIMGIANPVATPQEIAHAKRDIIRWLLPAAQQARNNPAGLGIAGVVDPTVAFVLGAKRLTISCRQYREAMERVNAAGIAAQHGQPPAVQ
jgi:hypothetical protein